MKGRPVDWWTFSLAVFSALIVSVPLILMSETLGPSIIALYDWTAFNLGIVYQWAAIGAMLVAGWLAFGPYGRVRLGKADDRPDFSTLSWVAMLFTAGVGGGLLYWAGIEWAYYLDSPPFGAEPRSAEAVRWATSYGLFHWGISAWCIYGLPAVALGYSFYNRQVPYLRFSASILGHSCATSPVGKLLDLVFMIGLLGGAATSLALTVPVISAGVAELSGLSRSVTMDLCVVAVCVGLFGLTVYLGLEKGIKRLADMNLWLALIFLAFILIAGPTTFILMTGTESLGHMASNLFEMITYTDAVGQSGFVQDWTIFYWAWWFAFAPFVGIFVTRISRGRTIREVLLGMSVFGSIGVWSFYIILGNYALHLELSGGMDVVGRVASDAPAAIASVIAHLPLGKVALAIFVVVVTVFVATTYNSASYTLASAATRALHEGEDPARWHRVFWAGILGLLPLGLMFIGGLKVVQSAVLLSGLPIAVSGVFMVIVLIRALSQDHT
ncbi:MAG: BCCT family transporter [Hyphomonas sp.]|nr:BCCT family transporter [Hyphomonas sp.]